MHQRYESSGPRRRKVTFSSIFLLFPFDVDSATDLDQIPFNCRYVKISHKTVVE